MPKWFSGLQFRLIVGFALALAIALGSVSVLVAFTAQRQARDFDRTINEARAARIQRFIANQYSSPDEIPPNLQATLEQAGAAFDRRIVVTDRQGNIIGDSERRLSGPFKRRPPRERLLPIVQGNREVGSVIVAPVDTPPPGDREPAASRLASALNRSLMMTGVMAGLIGIVIVSLISRRLLSPVNGLSLVAQKLGQGDLTQRAKVSGPSEIGELANTFNVMAENLQNAEQQRRNMVADVAHELRTPVSNIQGYLEAIKDGLIDSDGAIDTIYRQSTHLSTLIEDLRLLALAEAGNLRLDLQPYRLDQLLIESIEAVRPRAEAKGIKLSLDNGDIQRDVLLDKTRISQVVGNLLDNAIFHTPEGGSVRVSSAVSGDKVVISVADTGEGIPDDVMPMVFGRFYRVDPSRARATGGTGLGLTIAKQLVQAHGGSIRVESAQGQGTTFTFELPLTQDEIHA